MLMFQHEVCKQDRSAGTYFVEHAASGSSARIAFRSFTESVDSTAEVERATCEADVSSCFGTSSKIFDLLHAEIMPTLGHDGICEWLPTY